MRRAASGDLVDRAPTAVFLAAIAMMCAVIYLLRVSDHRPDDEELLLLVVPVALVALRFGRHGGLLAAAVAVGLVFSWDHTTPQVDLGSWAYVGRATAFFALGGTVGWLHDARRALSRRLQRAENVSLDLVATAGSDGYLKSVNPAWERTLGHSAAELLSRPYLEFVHPDDREQTLRQAAALGEGELSVSFRNRYLAADGHYRWLEWNAQRSRRDSLIYATARDVTIQQQAEELVRREAQELQSAVKERTRQLTDARLENLTRLALAAEYRDDETHQHTERVGRYCELIARELGLEPSLVRAIALAAPLHDVGKIGIPDHILLKPAALTDDEYELMKTHTTIGATILGGSESELLRLGEEIALTHHERWDGGGYPAGLCGEAIPIHGRIVAVADAYDAMTQTRPYREAMSVADAVAELERCSGAQFDPAVVGALIRALGPELAAAQRPCLTA